MLVDVAGADGREGAAQAVCACAAPCEGHGAGRLLLELGGIEFALGQRWRDDRTVLGGAHEREAAHGLESLDGQHDVPCAALTEAAAREHFREELDGLGGREGRGCERVARLCGAPERRVAGVGRDLGDVGARERACERLLIAVAMARVHDAKEHRVVVQAEEVDERVNHLAGELGIFEAAREDVRHASQRRLERRDLRHMMQQERLVRAALRAPCGGHGNRGAGSPAAPGRLLHVTQPQSCLCEAPKRSPAMPTAQEAAEQEAPSRMDAVLYQFYAKTVAVVCESRGQADSDAPRNKWFALELGASEAYRAPLRPWRALASARLPVVVPALVVSVRVRCLDAAYDVYAHVPHRTRLEHGVAVLLEQWRLDVRADEAPAQRLPAIYKQAVVHFRAMYAMAHTLPLSRVCQQLDHHALAVDVSIDAAPSSLDLPAKTWHMAPISTPLGSLQCRVDAATVHALSLERRERPSPRCGRAPPLLIDAASSSPRASVASVPGCEPGALRSLFTSSARMSSTPSSLARTPPSDAYMRAESPTEGAARPQRMPRYATQPSSYRHRHSPSLEDSSARSAGMRIGARRPAATARRDSLSSSSPTASSRVFGGRSPTAAFAVPRHRRTSTPHDALDLVAMIDARQHRESLDDEAAARPWATDWYDDLLGQLTHSLHLHALDEVFGPPPTPRRGVPIRETDTRH